MNDKTDKVYIIIIIILLIILGILSFFARKSCYEEIINHYETQLKQRDASIEKLKEDLADQHLKIILSDDKQLAYDIIYIDAELNREYLPELIGRPKSTNKDPSSPTLENPSIRNYTFETEYSKADYDELVKAFEEDADMRFLAVTIVQECFKNKDNDISIPDITINRSIEHSLQKAIPSKP